MTADEFVARLEVLATPGQREKYLRQFGFAGEVIGVRMGQVFELAKEFQAMPLDQIEELLDSDVHEARVGGVKIMARQAAARRTPDERRRELFDLYLRRHDRINTWDLVDLGAVDVVGRWLVDRPRDVLFSLARSADPWERRTAIVSTLFFVRSGDVDDTFEIAELLVHDEHELVQKAYGGLLREAGKKARPRLLEFLDSYAATMPRVALRYAIEHLEPDLRTHYLGLRKARG
ncbi:MAG TPA: DNA alkylation repair protein [Kribbellaceae bacterium]|nr:DNA alkylation repair protein [Kribbellaceae bacterium]